MALQRDGTGPLASADPTKCIANQVVLLKDASKGIYKVGSVRFVNGMSQRG